MATLNLLKYHHLNDLCRLTTPCYWRADEGKNHILADSLDEKFTGELW